MKSSSPLIITGMHRSGTSMLARFVRASGFSLGDQLVGPDAGNRYGHFEDAEFVDFHKAILARDNSNARPKSGDEQRARALLNARSAQPHWGWKDPRTCAFLEFWDRLLPEARYLFVVRHPLAVVDSLRRREREEKLHWRANTKILQMWLAYNRACRDIFQRHRDRSCLVILERLIHRPDRAVALFCERFGHPFQLKTFNEIFDPAALKQEAETPKLVAAHPVSLLRCLRFYRHLCRVADV